MLATRRCTETSHLKLSFAFSPCVTLVSALYLGANLIAGTIPEAIGALTRLTYVPGRDRDRGFTLACASLRHRCQTRSPVCCVAPPSSAPLCSALDLQENEMIVGTIPGSFSGLTNLQYVAFASGACACGPTCGLGHGELVVCLGIVCFLQSSAVILQLLEWHDSWRDPVGDDESNVGVVCTW